MNHTHAARVLDNLCGREAHMLPGEIAREDAIECALHCAHQGRVAGAHRIIRDELLEEFANEPQHRSKARMVGGVFVPGVRLPGRCLQWTAGIRELLDARREVSRIAAGRVVL